jgi:hypothetical protein
MQVQGKEQAQRTEALHVAIHLAPTSLASRQSPRHVPRGTHHPPPLFHLLNPRTRPGPSTTPTRPRIPIPNSSSASSDTGGSGGANQAGEQSHAKARGSIQARGRSRRSVVVLRLLLVPFVPTVRCRRARSLYTAGARDRARCLPLSPRTNAPRRSSRDRPAGGDGVAG